MKSCGYCRAGITSWFLVRLGRTSWCPVTAPRGSRYLDSPIVGEVPALLGINLWGLRTGDILTGGCRSVRRP